MGYDMWAPWFLSYGLVLGTSAALNTVFILYSVELFTHYSLSNVTSFWFYGGQTVYMVWNSFNDPFFGWFSDKQGIRRTQAIRYGGIVWGISFLLIWWPWSKVFYSDGRNGTMDVEKETSSLTIPISISFSSSSSSFTWFHILAGIHFTLTTCLYDSALTYVELNHSALLSEAIIDESVRAKANAYGAIMASVGTLTSLIAHSTWNMYDLTAYRIFVLGLTITSIALFHIAARGLDRNSFVNPSSSSSSHPSSLSTPVPPVSSTVPPYFTNATEEKNNKNNVTITSNVIYNDPNELGTLIHRRPQYNDDQQHRTEDTITPSATRILVYESSVPEAVSSSSHSLSSSTGTSSSSSSSSSTSRYQSYWIFLQQILSQRNVLIFMLMGALQALDCRFEKSFFSPFMTILTYDHSATVSLPDTNNNSVLLSSTYFHNLQGLALSLSFILPHLITLLVTPYITLYGIATVIETIFFLRITVLMVALLIGYRVSSVFIILFMLLNRILSEAVCRLSPLIGADIVDEDLYLQYHPSVTDSSSSSASFTTTGRKIVAKSSAAALLGTLAFTSRIAQSLAPMLGYTFLPYRNRDGYIDTNHVYNDYNKDKNPNPVLTVEGSSVHGSSEVPDILSGITLTEQQTVWNLLVYVPFVTVLLQLFLWRKYTLRDNYLKMIKTWIMDSRGENV